MNGYYLYLMESNVFSFEIPGHATRQEWAVYIIIASSESSNSFYVGKVGDNRNGCNPIVSRIGNHLSLNKVHSQIRNKLVTPACYNYKIFYATFGRYTDSNGSELERINELERRLNKMLQEEEVHVLNPFKGIGFINKQKKEIRSNAIQSGDLEVLKKLVENAVQYVVNLQSNKKLL